MLTRRLVIGRREKIEADLVMPPFPVGAEHVWMAFLRLRKRRADGPLSWQDLHAFMVATGFTLAPWEVEIVERLDDAWVRYRAGIETNRQPSA